MMKYKMKTLLVLLFFANTLSASAQQMPPSDIPTPTTASLGRYGDIPVSYYTGRANISIPIHTLSTGGVELPITLDYDGAGVQVNTLPSWTGHNWTLNAGGVITRKKNGEYDEWICTNQNEVNNYFIRNYFSSYNKNPHADAGEGMAEPNNSFIDLEPDEFIFNFMGKQGRFFLGNDGEWKVFCDEDIDVIFDINDTANFSSVIAQQFPKFGCYQSTSIKGFVLRDTNGISYHFGGENATEYSIPFFTKWEHDHFSPSSFTNEGGTTITIPPTSIWNNDDGLTSWMSNSWYLTDVIDRHGNTLYKFDYENGYFIAQFYNSFEKQDGIFANIPNAEMMFRPSNPKYDFPWNGTLSTSVYLSSISTMESVFVNFETADFPKSTEDLYPSLPKKRDGLSRFWEVDQKDNSFFYLYASDGKAPRYQYQKGDKNDPLNSTRLKYLKSISFHSLEMYRDIPRKDAINKLFGFDFDYKFSPRMHLTSVTKRPFNETSDNPERYNLEYNNYESLPEDYLTKAADHWGYYNGRDYNLRQICNPNAYIDHGSDREDHENLEPTEPDDNSQEDNHGQWDGNNEYYVNISNEYFCSFRNPDSISSHFGSLKKIIYPTGGWSAFEYEQKYFSRCVSLDRQNMRESIGYAGGLRIKSISEYDHNSNLLKRRTFSYTDPQTGNSSGELFATPCYYWRDWEVPLYNGENTNSSFHQRIIRMSSIIPLSNSFGPHIGYSCVTETNEDGSHIRYRYTNVSSAMDERSIGYEDKPLSPFEKFSEKGFMRGKLLSQMFYDKEGNLVRSTGFTYRNDYESYVNQFVYGTYKFYLNKSAYVSHPSHFPYFVSMLISLDSTYKLFYPRYDLVESRDTLFFDNGKTVVTSHAYNRQDRTLTLNAPYQHETNIRPLLSETVARNGESQITEYLLPFSSSRTLEREQLAGREFFVKPIGETLYINGNKIKTEEMHYESFNVKNKIFIAPKKMLRTSFPTTGSSSSATEEVLVTYHSYTPVGQVEKYQKLGGPMTTLLWNNLNNTLAAICVGGVPVGEPVYALDKNALNLGFDHLRMVNPHLQITSYTSSPLYGITSITQPNGNRTYFNYDGFFRLTDIFDHNNNLLNHYDYHFKE